MKDKLMLVGLGLLVLIFVVGCEALGGLEGAARKAFEEYAQSMGTPYKDASFQTISDDGTFATVRITAKLKESAYTDWVKKEAEIECRKVGREWRCDTWMEFSRARAEMLAEQAKARAAFITKWGTRGDDDGQFVLPSSVAVDGSGNVYVVDSVTCRIQKFTSDGDFITKWGSEGNVDGQFDRPWGIAVDAEDNVYVTDTDNDRIQKFTSEGTFITGRDFESPFGVTVGTDGNIYVVAGKAIYKFAPDGTPITNWDSGADSETYPIDIAVAGCDAYVVYIGLDSGIRRFTSEGVFIESWGGKGRGDGYGQFSDPWGIAADVKGNVYIADTGNHRIQAFTPDGTFITSWGSYGNGDGQFYRAADVAIDTNGGIYVADYDGERIQKFHVGK